MATTPPKRRCGTEPVHERLLKSDPNYAANRGRSENYALEYARTQGLTGRTGITVIPVVVHVIHKTTAQNISDAQINSQIDVLNQDFRKSNPDIVNLPAAFAPLAADARIEFQLATSDPSGNPTNGITRTSTTSTSFSADDKMKSSATGGHDAWPRDDYLNLWVCNLGGGLLGYAQFPGGPAATDGVVVTHTGFGTVGTAAAPFNLGRTSTHEIGHFLNLRHIWGDERPHEDPCSKSDFVGDTPNQGGPNYSTPTFPKVSCGNGPNGDLFMNYMDYVDDVAMFMFTAGQVTRMHACLDGDRASLGFPKTTPTLKFSDDPQTLKFRDDPQTLKFRDDPQTLKFRDDPQTFKFRDDPQTSKFRDDPQTSKFRDDPQTSKFRDDPQTSKFSDDPQTLKFRDDPQTSKFRDDPQTLKFRDDPQSFKFTDDPQNADFGGDQRGATPFILSTPHHSMAWTRSFPEAFEAEVASVEQEIMQLEQILEEYQEGDQSGQLTDLDRQQAEQVYEEYSQLVAEYLRMTEGD